MAKPPGEQSVSLDTYKEQFGDSAGFFKTHPISQRDHDESGIHHIGGSLPVPSVIKSVGATNSLGTSPIPAREDHVHASATAGGVQNLGIGVRCVDNQSIPTNNWTLVKAENFIWNDIGATIGAAGRITIPKAGRYLLRGQVNTRESSTAVGRVTVSFEVNQTLQNSHQSGYAFPGSLNFMTPNEATAIVNLNANDTIGLQYFHSGGVNWTTNALYTVIYAEMLGGMVGPKGDIGPQGEPGVAGPIGPAGPTGQAEEWIVGSGGAPNPAVGKPGDLYLNTSNGDVYEKLSDNTTWTLRGNIRGPQGIQGPKGDTGAQGSQGPQGIQGPTGNTGSQGPPGNTGPQGPQGNPGADSTVPGPQGPQGPKGDTGAQGIQGIQGPKGDKGDTGATGSTGAQGPQGNPGVQGPQGIQGPQGPQGPTGQAEAWYSGTSNPAAGTGVVGDWYLNTTSGDVFEKTGSSTWTLQGNIRGPQGIQGIQGPTGSTGSQGPQGNPGPTGQAEAWFSGTGIPSGAVGVVGDWYLDTASGDVYEKTASSTWTSRGNIKGPQGNVGSTGAQGPKGDTGSQGPKGDTGSQGPPGTPGEGLFIGSVIMWPAYAAQIPAKFLQCNGAALSRTTYVDLFNVIGVIWGAGDGSSTFNLPDFVNFFPYGGTSPAVSGGFADAVVVDHNHPMPHTHTLAHTHDVSSRVAVGTAGGAVQGGTGQSASNAVTSNQSATTTSGVSTPNTSNAGASGTGRNLPPYKSVIFIIRALA